MKYNRKQGPGCTSSTVHAGTLCISTVTCLIRLRDPLELLWGIGVFVFVLQQVAGILLTACRRCTHVHGDATDTHVVCACWCTYGHKLVLQHHCSPGATAERACSRTRGLPWRPRSP